MHTRSMFTMSHGIIIRNDSFITALLQHIIIVRIKRAICGVRGVGLIKRVDIHPGNEANWLILHASQELTTEVVEVASDTHDRTGRKS